MKLTRTIGFSAGVLAASSVASYALGLLRDRLLAGKFGASVELDVFNASFLVPDAIMTIFAAALTSAFIPVFTNWWHTHGETETWALVNTVLRITAIGIVATGILAWLVMPWLSQLVAPGFTETSRQLLISTSRWMLVSPLLFGISIVCGSALQGRQRFISYAISPVIYNLGIVFGIMVLSPTFGVHGVVYGVLIGGVGHAAVRCIELVSSGWKWQTKSVQCATAWQHPGIRETVRLMVPRMIGLLLGQANLWIYTAIGSGLAMGSVAIFNLARNFQSLPVSLFGIALATALFPALASRFAKQESSHFAQDLGKGLRQLLFFTIPAAVGMMLLARPLVDLFLGTGNFTASAVIATGATLAIFALSIPFESVQHILARAFYAQHDTITPVWVTLAATVANVITCLLLSRWIQVSGLAAGFVVFSLVQVSLLFWLLRKKIPTLHELKLVQPILKISIASAVMGSGVFLITQYVSNSFIILLTGVIGGGIIYVICAALLQMPELTATVRLVKKLIVKNTI